MKTRSLAALALLAAAPAFGQIVTLDFEGAVGYAQSIDQFYNGGTDGVGQSGPNYGVAFTSDAVAVSNDAIQTYYSGAPSPLTTLFALGSNAFMNVDSGFAGTLTFAYSAFASSVVSIYSGLNGTGSLLGTASLSGNSSDGCNTDFCNFDFTSVQFAGVARSVNFGETPNQAFYDNVTIALVPEPSAYLLMALGLAGVGVLTRRRAAAASA